MSTRTSFHIPALALAAVALAFTACSDDHDLPTSSRVIRFQVSDASWQATRSEAPRAQALPSVVLKADEQQLYLLPQVSQGIELGPDASVRKVATRAAQTTTDDIASMGVYAATGTDQAYYMGNVEVTRDNDWAPRKEYLWPGSGSLHINAYSPYCAAASDVEGVTALPSADARTAPALAYTVPADVTEQTDLMWATPRNASSSPCQLTFNHALAAVRFVAGSEMTPCTVKSISISGLKGSGTLSLESGDWSDMSGSETYTATVDAALAADGDSQYAPAGTVITDADHTFMLLPQALGSDVAVTMVIDVDGVESQFSASLDGQSWAAGNTYTYHLSANPAEDRFIITVDSPISFNYTGGTGTFAVKSIHETLGGSATQEDVPWTAEFVDANGNVIDTPSWITAFALSGDGSGDFSASTQMVEPSFIAMSEPTRWLRQQADRGSEAAPYNLASASGSTAVENTANSYIINAPGTYSIPLVYGNAIKDGADNTAAYAPARTSEPFVTHLGTRIKHPYIYDNDGCTPAGAKLVWEGRLNMVHDLHLSADGHSLVFTLPQAYIRQGNAVVAVTDADGAIMWSWQLWITDYIAGQDMSTMSYNGTSFEIMPYNMGYVLGGDEVDFASSSALVRFTQHPADGSAGSSVTVTVQQTGKHIITPDCYSFYQWGRKDPMISGIKEWYYDDHTEITEIDTRTLTLTAGKVEADFDAKCILNPQAFWVASGTEPVFKFTNNWNLGTSSRRVKTVYDPCPPGFMVPGNEFIALRDMAASSITYTTGSGIADPSGFHVTTASGPELFFPALGYRSGNSGKETVSDASGGILTAMWTSHANTKEASGLVLNYHPGTITHTFASDPRLEAFAIRPIKE